LNDYSPEKLSEKWKGHTAGLLEILTKRWESGRAQKRFFSIGLPEPDASLDRVAPFKAKRILLYEGIVVMGHVARAFFPAYIPGKGAHYGSVVYSADPAPVDSLFELAWRVNELRKDNTSPPLGTEKVAAAIRDDRSQFARILLPPSIGGVTRAFFANICIHRSRLPLGYIHDRLVPLLIAPDKTDWCTILPLRFWDEEFKRIWSSGPAVYDQKEFKLRCQVLGIRP
jgi:hypothetical protein